MEAQQGSAYTLVLAVMMIVFLMTAVLLNITGYEMKIAREREGYSELYNLAVSGAEKERLDLLEKLRGVEPDIEEKVFQELKKLNWYDHLIYQDGWFHARTKGSRPTETLYTDAVQAAADPYFLNHQQSFSCSLSFDSTAPERCYQITAKFLPGYFVEASAEMCPSNDHPDDNPEDRPKVKVRASLEWDIPAHAEIFIPDLIWGSQPEIFQKAVSCAGTVYLDGAETEAPKTDASVLNAQFSQMSALPSEWDWSEMNAVVVGRGVSLDVSAFYGSDGVPQPTCIINTEGNLRLTGQQDDQPDNRPDDCPEAQNQFVGVIFAGEDVFLDGVSLTGNLFCLGNVWLGGSQAPPVCNPDMLFQIRVADWELQKRLLDFLGVTDFQHAVNNSTDIVGILQHAALSDRFSLRIDPFPAMPLTLRKLKKVAP
ncbi:MAG: hypothetical protein LBT44_01365 [Clostridiales bacterium]|nr:hypothetical protein [Clostridiales bacterium]